MFFPGLGLHWMHFHCGFKAGANVSAQKKRNSLSQSMRSIQDYVASSFVRPSHNQNWVDVSTAMTCCKISFLVFVQDSWIWKEKAEEVATRNSRRTCVVGFSLSRNSSGAIGRCFIINVESVFESVRTRKLYVCMYFLKSCMFQKGGTFVLAQMF